MADDKRYETDMTASRAVSVMPAALGALALVGAGLAVGALFRSRRAHDRTRGGAAGMPASAMRTTDSTDGEHVPVDLTPDAVGDRAAMAEGRAPAAFRPDRDAPVAPAERDAFAPATMKPPPLSVTRGNGDDDDADNTRG